MAFSFACDFNTAAATTGQLLSTAEKWSSPEQARGQHFKSGVAKTPAPPKDLAGGALTPPQGLESESCCDSSLELGSQLPREENLSHHPAERASVGISLQGTSVLTPCLLRPPKLSVLHCGDHVASLGMECPSETSTLSHGETGGSTVRPGCGCQPCPYTSPSHPPGLPEQHGAQPH